MLLRPGTVYYSLVFPHYRHCLFVDQVEASMVPDHQRLDQQNLGAVDAQRLKAWREGVVTLHK